MIEFRGIKKVYRTGTQSLEALRGLTLEIGRGEFVSIMGPSGSGKSTLLNILGCLDRPTEGSYRLDGREVAGLDENELALARRHRIGFVFQTFHLIPRLTAEGNVELPMVFAGVDPSERKKRADEALAAVGLSDRAHHTPDQLSGGERQRVAIARAVVMHPSILLADEPTGNLDRASGSEVIALLERMNASGLTLVVVTHDPAIGRRAARTIHLADGAIVEAS
jgi:putative ABC transport system ATP-binding protein